MAGIFVMRNNFGGNQLRQVVSAVLITALAACGGPSRDVVGKWRTGSEPNDVVWEFADNGGGTIGRTHGRYRFGGSGRVKIETPSGTTVYHAQNSHQPNTLPQTTPSPPPFL